MQGLGIVTCLGRGLKAQVAALREAKSEPGTVPCGDSGSFQFHSVGDGGGAECFHRRIEQVVEDALADADLSRSEIAGMGIFIGTSSVDLYLRELEFIRRMNGAAAAREMQWEIGEVASFIAAKFGIRGPQFTFTTACSSSANAMIYAARMLRASRIPRALVIGTEHFNRVSLHGFESMMLLSKTSMRPFDERRDGVVLGEGTGALVLGAQDTSGGGLPNAFFRGAATMTDPTGITCSSAECTAQVMAEALREADISADRITAIKAHGVGTPAGDRSEGQGLRLLYSGAMPPVTSFKPSIGHTLGACAVLETVAFLGCVQERFIPPTPGFEQADPAIGCEPLRRAKEVAAGYFLLNHFGFGGSNTALVFSTQP